jgi:predicted ribosome quality control (RQC) complex YloA/Tae2 family protein
MAELSGLEVMVLAREIGAALRGTYVAGAYSIGENQIVKFKRPGAEDTWLIASPRYGSWVSKRVAERAETTEFTSRLRGEVERLRFASSTQVDMDRVFDLALGEEDSLRHVIVELMPPGNLAVTDGGGKLRLLLREVRSERRRLVRGGSYSPPPQTRRNPATVTAAEIEVILRSEKTVGRAIGRNVSLPRKYVHEVLARLGTDEAKPAADMLDRSGEVASTLRTLVEEAIRSPSPSICETPEGDEIYVIEPRRLRAKKQSTSLCDLCDEVFLPLVTREIERPEPGEAKRRETEATVERLRLQEKQDRDKAAKLREEAQNARNATSLEGALGILERMGGVETRRAPRSKEAVSSLLFARAKELERKADDAGAAAIRLRSRFGKKPKEKAATRKLSRKPSAWYEKFRWFSTSGEKLAVGGRDAQSNELLVKRHVDDEDTVYHADLFGSPFFVLKGGKHQTQDEIQEVAQATVSFSSAWKTGLGSADAYWVLKDQVSTSAPSGEYLPRGSFMIRGKKNMVGRNLVQIAAGLDNEGRILCGPETAVSRAALCYVVLTPHREKPSETAKKVARELSRLCGKNLDVSIDDVLRALPPGGGKILRVKAGAGERRPPTANL